MRKKRRILLVIDQLIGGGAERVMSYLANGFDKNSHEVILHMSLGTLKHYDINEDVPVIYPWGEGLDESVLTSMIRGTPPLFSSQFKYFFLAQVISTAMNLPLHLKQSGFSINSFRKNRHEMAQYLRDFYNASAVLNAVCLKYKPDVIVSFLHNTNIISLLSKTLFKFDTPVICSDHMTISIELDSFTYPRLHKLATRWLYKKADMHLCVSDDAYNDLQDYLGIPATRISKISNGIDLEWVSAKGKEPIEDEHAELFGNDGLFRIINMGRLSEQKAQDYLIRSFKKVREKIESKLFILGEGVKKEDLIKLSHDLGVANDVHFLGWQKNPFKFISRCDLFALSSSWEAHPMVLIEAMALGKPVVSTDSSMGVQDMLGEGKYGKIVPTRDEEALCEAILDIANNDTIKKELSKLSEKRSKDYSLDNMLKNYDRLFDEMLN